MSNSPGWLWNPPRHLFFTGKGGVGKTSLASASAVFLADAGSRVLLVGTDPACNLSEVFGTRISVEPVPVESCPGLHVMNINPARAAEEYRERIVGPLRGVLPEAALASVEEQLSGACTMEIAAFEVFARLLAGENRGEYDHVVFDTAPTGHTLRLLSLPKAWTGFLDSTTSGTSCLGPLAGLQEQRGTYAKALQTLCTPEATAIYLVSRAGAPPLKEAAKSADELSKLGIGNMHLLLNGLLTNPAPDDRVAMAWASLENEALANMPTVLKSLPSHRIPLRPGNVLGIDSLRILTGGNGGIDADIQTQQSRFIPETEFLPSDELIEELAAPGRGIIFTMGKGGVGKTTIAAFIAMKLAERGHPVTLSTTDPAAHVLDAVGDGISNLTVSRIDPAAETKAYVEEVMRSQPAEMDPDMLRLMEEDLRSPCTEEIAVFRAFARTVASAEEGFVVLDTAPTGHTLLLLDASQAYHRELSRQSRTDGNETVRGLLPRLRDPEFARVLIVTTPESTPVHEAQALQEDLQRAGIGVFGWMVNQSLSRLEITDPLLRQRAQLEQDRLQEVLTLSSGRAWLMAWNVETLEEPVSV